jgi:hypothetical protein
MADTLTPAQQAFIKSITNQVNQLLGTRLPGKFEVVSYPPGFNYGIQYGSPPVTNATTLDAFNSTLTRGTNGVLTLGNDVFSTMYLKILAGASYQYSKSDNAVTQDSNIQSQQIAVVQEATTGGYADEYKIPAPVTYPKVIASVLDKFGTTDHKTFSSGDILAAARGLGNTGFSGLQQAISNAQNQLGPLNAILNAQSEATRELSAAQQNTQHPTKTNGALQTVSNPETYYVGWSGLPSNNQVMGGLESGSKLHIEIKASNFSSTSTTFTVDGSTGFTVPIWDLVELGVKASVHYDMSKYTSSSSSLDMALDYPGLSIVQIDPTRLSGDYATGWYDQSLLQSIIQGSNDPNISGFKIPGDSQWNVHDTFGEGKKLSRLKTFVISQAPTITMTFDAGNSEAITSDFKETASLSVKLFGLFQIGSVDQSYRVQKVDRTSASGKIIVTLAPPDIKGTVPLAQQVCYVVGGVAEYPPPA